VELGHGKKRRLGLERERCCVEGRSFGRVGNFRRTPPDPTSLGRTHARSAGLLFGFREGG
jgi:hypothetical protein